MALSVLRILKEIAPLVVQAGGVAAGLRSGATKADERIGRLEHEVVRAGDVLTALAEQLQALAQELHRQAEATAALQKRLWILLAVAVGALGVSGVALGVAWLH